MTNYEHTTSAAKWLEHLKAANDLYRTAKEELANLERQRPYFQYKDKRGELVKTTAQLYPEYLFMPDKVMPNDAVPQFILWLCKVYGTPPELLNQKVDKETPEK